MKVLFISSWYPNSVHPLKGIFVKKHAAAIKASGADIQVVAITVSPTNKTLERKLYSHTDENGIVTHQIELNSRFYKWIHVSLFLQYRLISSYIEKNILPTYKPDIIHSNVLFPAGIIGYKLSKRFHLPHVITEHWSKVQKFMKESLYAYSGKKAYNKAKAVTVVSSFLKNNISQFISDANKIQVVPNVINTSQFNYKEKKNNEEQIVFTCVAHWTNPKRPDLIFHSLNEFAKSHKNKIVLNVVGEGILLNELKKSNYRFEVNYKGNVEPERLAVLLQETDYFLHASEIETFSIVIAEALATGTPVLASNVGAIPELINKGNGITVNNSVGEWIKGLHAIVEKQFDYKKISETALKFSPAYIGNSFMKIYSEK